mgnify:CR=1 FL=1
MENNSASQLLRTKRFLPFFITQFLGAFNDNLYKQALITLITFGTFAHYSSNTLNNLGAALFILPFFLFSAFAGQLVSYQLKQLVDRQVNFRLPPPGVKVVDGRVKVNAAYPGLGIAWSEDKTHWQPVTKELTLMPEYYFRTFLPGTDRVSASVQPAKAAATQQ